jgi:hypothetical protein
MKVTRRIIVKEATEHAGVAILFVLSLALLSLITT